MADLVPTDQIEDIVGARRHPFKHLARCDTSAEMVYVLHAAGCVASTSDLRLCRYSRALDNGVDDRWRGWEDRPVVVAIDPPTLRLVPMAEVAEPGGSRP